MRPKGEKEGERQRDRGERKMRDSREIKVREGEETEEK
jgi:hypothetical protein